MFKHILISTDGSKLAAKGGPALDATIHGLFRRWPALLGFSVQDADTLRADGESAQIENELYLADLETYPPAGHEQHCRLFGDIAIALLELMDERPEARELLRGRTFARTLH